MLVLVYTANNMDSFVSTARYESVKQFGDILECFQVVQWH